MSYDRRTLCIWTSSYEKISEKLFWAKHLHDVLQKNQLSIFSLLESTTIWCLIRKESKKDLTVPKDDSWHFWGKSFFHSLIVLFDGLPNLFFIITHKFSMGLRLWDNVLHFRIFILLSSSRFMVYIKILKIVLLH